MSEGILYIVATPIGNLEDITLRALRILRECDCIACEDTRHTLRLLNHFEISKPLISYHKFNELARLDEIEQRLQQGQVIALVSDAGLPGICDPGFEAVRFCRQRGYSVTVLPGASAGLTALLLSGIDCTRFAFEGFLPEDKKQRRAALDALQKEPRTAVIYESPHNLAATLKDLAAFENRTVAVCKELTKIHEQCAVMRTDEIPAWLAQAEPRGEYVLILSGAPPVQAVPQGSIPQQVQALINSGTDKKEAIKQVAKANNLTKNDVYMQCIDL